MRAPSLAVPASLRLQHPGSSSPNQNAFHRLRRWSSAQLKMPFRTSCDARCSPRIFWPAPHHCERASRRGGPGALECWGVRPAVAPTPRLTKCQLSLCRQRIHVETRGTSTLIASSQNGAAVCAASVLDDAFSSVGTRSLMQEAVATPAEEGKPTTQRRFDCEASRVQVSMPTVTYVLGFVYERAAA